MDAENKKRKSRFFPGFVLGLVLGTVGAVLAPSWWQSIVPDSLFPQGTVSGLVLQKDRESGRLLVKLATGEGVLLATFTERQDAIDLLVELGDTVTLRVARYQPFLTDPRLDRVRKPETAKGTAPAREETKTKPSEPSESGQPSEPAAQEEPAESTTTTTTTIPS
jgi:hypothetical protein